MSLKRRRRMSHCRKNEKGWTSEGMTLFSESKLLPLTEEAKSRSASSLLLDEFSHQEVFLSP